MCEFMLESGNTTVEGSNAQSTVNTFDFIFYMRLTGKRASLAGQGQGCAEGENDGHGNKDINPEVVNISYGRGEKFLAHSL